jgi:predicted acetyltransferase
VLLTAPDLCFEDAFRRYVDDYRRAGDATRLAKYAAGASDYPAYIESLRLATTGKGLAEGHVAYSTFWLVDDGDIVGIVRVRPQLTPKVEKNDGHIGYDVAPSKRNRGYGTALLRLALEEAKRLGLNRLIVTCETTNGASRRVIEKCGGRLLGEVFDEDDNRNVYRFEVAVSEPNR